MVYNTQTPGLGKRNSVQTKITKQLQIGESFHERIETQINKRNIIFKCTIPGLFFFIFVFSIH